MGETVHLADVIGRAQESRLADLWTASIGIVESYDATTRTADVRPLLLRPIENGDTGAIDHEKIPILPSVSVLFPSSPFGGFSWPIPKGTTGLLVFLTLSPAKWRVGAADGGTEAEPGDLRLHHPAHAVFVPGLVPDTASTPRTAENAIVVEGADVRLGAYDASDFVALASLVKARLDALQAAHDGHKHAVTGGNTGVPDMLVGSLADVAATLVKAK